MTYIEPQKEKEPSKNTAKFTSFSLNSTKCIHRLKIIILIVASILEMAPQVTILGLAKVSVDRNKPLTLKCKVEAHPDPYISWENDLGIKFEPEVRFKINYMFIVLTMALLYRRLIALVSSITHCWTHTILVDFKFIPRLCSLCRANQKIPTI